MTWQQLKIYAPKALALELSEVLLDLGAVSSVIEDADAQTTQEQSIFNELGQQGEETLIWANNVVSALFDAEVHVNAIIEQVQQLPGMAGLRCFVDAVPDQDWVTAFQAQFDPVKINPHLWIVPSWHSPPDPSAINLMIDPGLAFGTGTHPTTALCLNWLSTHIHGGESVLDYGCGSGVLAIAAKLLGAGAVCGVDIDPQAVLVSQQNARQNRVDIRFAVAEHVSSHTADIVVANILANPIRVLAPLLIRSCVPGGQIVLSGITRDQVNSVCDCYATSFTFEPPEYLENWALLVGRKLEDLPAS